MWWYPRNNLWLICCVQLINWISNISTKFFGLPFSLQAVFWAQPMVSQNETSVRETAWQPVCFFARVRFLSWRVVQTRHRVHFHSASSRHASNTCTVAVSEVLASADSHFISFCVCVCSPAQLYLTADMIQRHKGKKVHFPIQFIYWGSCVQCTSQHLSGTETALNLEVYNWWSNLLHTMTPTGWWTGWGDPI